MTRNPLTHHTLALALAMGLLAFAGDAVAKVQTMIVTSDPQYPWTDRTDARVPESDSERDSRSEALITEQYRSIAAYRAARPGQDIPVFVNGDLTAYGHGKELDVMERLLPLLGDNVHLGLGNHDYQNNIRQDDDSGCFNNWCARESIRALVKHVTQKAGKVAFDFAVSPGVFTTVYKGSLAYAVDAPGLDRVLSIQLNNFPEYQVAFESVEGVGVGRYEIDSSLTWLRNLLGNKLEKPRFGDWEDREYDLAIVHMHDPTRYEDDFVTLVTNTDVAAIFAGHLHRSMGRYGRIGEVPVFLSGSASQRTYLIVEHDTDEGVLRVYGVRDNQPEQKTLIDTVPVHRHH
ncbi:MAG TPA: metallophosphoesterase [Luteibacter sp.]|uniref:metallophosphoesterase n=1 Tax=Luteibacter sp. TaxID=1886636 RepID=UPI002C9F3206|nr:metallophosphoesterase [Luteibacter sp.]HVI54564.1 metallophosphoesterase [Luteibacter sp.]